MPEMDSNVTEAAKSLANVADKAADLLHKLTAPMCEQTGLLLGERMKAYRERRLHETLEKADRLLRDSGLEPNPVPPKLLLPIIDGCSIEDNETLQDMWAGLLTSASQQPDRIRTSFADTLKQLTPNEAKFLDSVFGNYDDSGSVILLGMTIDERSFTEEYGAPSGISIESFERLGFIQKAFRVNLQEAVSHALISGDVEAALRRFSRSIPEALYDYEWTQYAVEFMSACHGPKRMNNLRCT